jgi:hypothetical protein
MKHPGLVDLITTKQNKTNYLLSWIDVPLPLSFFFQSTNQEIL